MLGARVLDVVVVVVELGIRVGLGGGSEGDWDVVSAQGVVEDRGSVCAIVGDGLVHHVPRITLTLVVTDFVGDVGLDHRCQGLSSPGAGRNYTWKLGLRLGDSARGYRESHEPHDGSWEYHTSVWHRRSCPLASASSAIWSPLV